MGIDKNRNLSRSGAELRRHAEERLREKAEEVQPYRNEQNMQRLVHELQVHQIELEMQNEELRQAREDLETALEKFTDLYDFAPVGYVSLDHDGVISSVNLNGAGLLGIERSQLIGVHFVQYIAVEDRPAFTTFLGTVFSSKRKETCEMALLNKDNFTLIMQIEAKATASGQTCRLALIDITRRRLVEDALRASEERLYKLADMAPDAIIMLDDSGTVTFCNAAAIRMFGCSDKGTKHCDFHRHFIPEQFLTAKQGFDQFKKQGTGALIGKSTEVVALRNDGTKFPVELSISSLKLQGKWHAISIIRDVTERKRVEMALQKSEQKFSKVFHSVPALISISSLKEGKFIDVNQTFLQTFGYKREETIGTTANALGLWEDESERARLIQTMEAEGTVRNMEVRLKGTAGQTIIGLLSAEFIDIEDDRHMLTLVRDITEHKLAEERISEVMRQQQAILDNIPNIAWLKDREGRYVAVNHPFSKALGMLPEDLVGKNDYDIYPPELAAKYEKDFRHVIGSGTRAYIEESLVDREGKIQHLEKIKTPIFNDAGEVIGIIGIAHDITSRKEVEVSLRHDSTHDILTGLYNRSFFEEELDRLSRSRMFPLSIVMADVNCLKTVNDSQGHAAGDDLIRMAGRIILEAFRSEDIVARIGGDEFAVLLPGTTTTVAEEAVERIMKCPEIINCQVSIAFGIATAECKDQLAEALKLSDKRMYRDKSGQKAL